MAPKCGVCRIEDSKYKCPVCELKYCSIACYKSHKSIHESRESGQSTNDQQVLQPKRDRPGTTQRVPKVDFSGFESDKDFQRLLTRYPVLKVQLQTIYALTLEPGPDEARTWNRQPLPNLTQPSFLTRASGGGYRGRRGGRGGWDSAQEERQRGPWTPEKGNKEALSIIKKMRDAGGEENELGEGMREFVDLCEIKFGGNNDGS